MEVSETPIDLLVRVEEHADALVLLPFGEIDTYTAPVLRQQLTAATDAPGRTVLVDLKGVAYIDSTGLGLLIGALKKARAHGGTVEVVCDDEKIRRLFELTGLDEIFVIHGERPAKSA